MREIYLLEATIGEWEDKHTYNVCYFDDYNRAILACNGFNNVVEELERIDYAAYLNSAYDHIYGDYIYPTREQHQRAKEIYDMVKMDVEEYPLYTVAKVQSYDTM